MTFIANAVLGHFAQAAMGGLSDNQPNFHGRTVRPLGHWSSTLLWVTTALCVAGCVVAALATAMPMFVEMTAILMPVFSVTLGLIGASCAIGAYYISQFVPEYAFEENVREFQAVVTQYEQQVHGLQHQTQELQHRLEELDAINKEFDTTTTTLKEENERIKLTIGQFDEGSVDLAKRNVELQVRVVEFTKLFDEHENQIGEYESANKELKEQSLLLANELATAKSGMADFVKKMEELNATKESLAKHIGILQVELETQRSIKKATDEEIEGLRLEIIDVLKKLKASEKMIQDLSTTNKSLEERSEKLESTNQDLRKNIDRLNTNISTLQVSFEKVDKALKGMNQTSDSLGAATEKLSGIVGVGRAFVDEGEKQSIKVQEQVDQFLSTVEEQKKLVASLLTVKDDLERLQTAKEQVDHEVERLSLQIQVLQKENRDLRLLIDQLSKSTTQQDKENDRSEDILERMKAANEAFARLLETPFKDL